MESANIIGHSDIQWGGGGGKIIKAWNFGLSYIIYEIMYRVASKSVNIYTH